MIKTAILLTATALGFAAPALPTSTIRPAAPSVTEADPAFMALLPAKKVIAQFAYLEVQHGAEGFGFSITDQTGVFVDVEFPGDLYVRIGL